MNSYLPSIHFVVYKQFFETLRYLWNYRGYLGPSQDNGRTWSVKSVKKSNYLWPFFFFFMLVYWLKIPSRLKLPTKSSQDASGRRLSTPLYHFDYDFYNEYADGSDDRRRTSRDSRVSWPSLLPRAGLCFFYFVFVSQQSWFWAFSFFCLMKFFILLASWHPSLSRRLARGWPSRLWGPLWLRIAEEEQRWVVRMEERRWDEYEEHHYGEG